MTDQGLIIAIVGINLFIMSMVIPLIAFIRLGGWPEGFYRIFRIKYFSAIFIDAEGTPRRFPLRFSILKTGAPELPAYFEYKGFANGVGRYYTDKLNQTKHNGRMSQYYYPDNPFPIPIMTMARSTLLGAEQLEKAFNDETVIDFLKVGKEKKEKKSSRLKTLAILFIVFIATVAGLAFLLR
jgi:hypothetical protein